MREALEALWPAMDVWNGGLKEGTNQMVKVTE